MTATTSLSASNTSLDVGITANEGRRTFPPVDRQFRAALGQSASALLSGVEAAAPFVPGVGMVAAALSSGGGLGDTALGDAGTGTMGDTLRYTTNQSMQYLELQQRISAEDRKYTTMSNVLKARHESAKSAINNIR